MAAYLLRQCACHRGLLPCRHHTLEGSRPCNDTQPSHENMASASSCRLVVLPLGMHGLHGQHMAGTC